jgi:hypothetical protein
MARQHREVIGHNQRQVPNLRPSTPESLPLNYVDHNSHGTVQASLSVQASTRQGPLPNKLPKPPNVMARL